MKTPLLIFFCATTIVACKNTGEASKESAEVRVLKLHEGNWVTNFKNEVFLRCLKKLYPSNFGAMLDTLDASSSANIDHLDYNHEIIGAADSLAEAFVKKPSASWTIENKKVTANVCLEFRNSAELDKATLRFYNKMRDHHKD